MDAAAPSARLSARTRRRQWFTLLALSAALQVLSFPVAAPLPFWRAQLAWFAFVPLLAVLAASLES